MSTAIIDNNSKKEQKPKTGDFMHLIKALRVGDSFYTTSSQATVQAYASKFKVKVHTEVVLIVEVYTSQPVTKRGIKVTIISK